jgi:hypothetical protein
VTRVLSVLAIAVVASCGTISTPTPTAADPWHVVELPASAGPTLVSLAVTNDLMVVVGTAGERTMAWSSTDGTTWKGESIAGAFGFPDRGLRFGARVVVVGSNQTDRCAHPGEVVFWVREANGRWATAPFDSLFCAGGSALVAASDDTVATLGNGTGDVSYGWFSKDALHWVDSRLRHDIRPQSLATNAGNFVALGTFENGQWWFGRSNGRAAWTFEAARGLPIGPTVFGFVQGGEGWIAWLGEAIGEQRAYTSARGDVWHSVDQNGLDQAVISAPGKSGTGFLARGSDGVGEFLLSSADARTWRRLATPQSLGNSASIRDFAAFKQRVFELAGNDPDAQPQLFAGDAALLAP